MPNHTGDVEAKPDCCDKPDKQLDCEEVSTRLPPTAKNRMVPLVPQRTPALTLMTGQELKPGKFQPQTGVSIPPSLFYCDSRNPTRVGIRLSIRNTIPGLHNCIVKIRIAEICAAAVPARVTVLAAPSLGRTRARLAGACAPTACAASARTRSTRLGHACTTPANCYFKLARG